MNMVKVLRIDLLCKKIPTEIGYPWIDEQAVDILLVILIKIIKFNS